MLARRQRGHRQRRLRLVGVRDHCEVDGRIGQHRLRRWIDRHAGQVGTNLRRIAGYHREQVQSVQGTDQWRMECLSDEAVADQPDPFGCLDCITRFLLEINPHSFG